ncbi:GGDEF domain-containing protein [Actinokineospora auranticolor]|uniref:Diguanylate cyclase (GGDEF)-like protein n=1 Tax=Actinokineospora auranticolor TaxID=155976 RepID=A0A2S6GKT3_9PSEU|nr:GGDEF domain-containing protein [Actinokineospora auranticolor]PPK65800.1 diguanylate cyclase (GGDEF)-like protein [Actinokineospora auranticolor]
MRGLAVARRIRALDLRGHTTAAGFLWIIAAEVAVCAWVVVSTLAAGPVDGYSLWVLGLLTACAVAHIEATRTAEMRRWAAPVTGEHIDHAGVWTFAGALLLPVPVVVVLVLAIRLRRYFIIRKPLGRYVFTTCAVTSSVLAAHAVATVSGVHDWVRGAPIPPERVASAALMVTAAFALYYVAQTVVIGVARGLRTGWSLVGMLGDRRQNFDLVVTLCLGLVGAWGAGVANGALLVGVLVVVVAYTRHTQRIELLEQERDRLEVDALHDPLTGLANQRGFNRAAALALLADHARQRRTAVLMFDLDRFKQVNSRLGHLGANEVLKGLAAVLRDSVGSDDLVCRWGGEEFSVVVPSTTRSDAWAVAELVRASVESMMVRLTKAGRAEWVGGFTISGGIAFSPEHGADLATLQECADQALAEAKEGGRNQVRVCPALPARILDTPL